MKRIKNFCLTFFKKTNIITDERVANLRKSSFAARFLFCICQKKCVAYQRKSNLFCAEKGG